MLPSVMDPNLALTVAYFISPHGFGHASRSSAVMEALKKLCPGIHFEIYTTIPEWFFQDSLNDGYTYHYLKSDIGLVQKDPLNADIPETIRCLEKFIPFESNLIKSLAHTIRQKKCQLVLCDISPMGIEVAKEAGILSVLIENFTWDWIYQGYKDQYPDLEKVIKFKKNLFEAADYHIQTEPICIPGKPDLSTNPISRKVRVNKTEFRDKLGMADNQKLVTITMGGIPQEYTLSEKMQRKSEFFFVIPGGCTSLVKKGNLILLPHKSDIFHPDLINASDMVIGKLGYSTLSEIYHTGCPFGYISRPDFLESEKLSRFIQKNMVGIDIPPDAFDDGDWLDYLYELSKLPTTETRHINGAIQAADFICSILATVTD